MGFQLIRFHPIGRVDLGLHYFVAPEKFPTNPISPNR